MSYFRKHIALGMLALLYLATWFGLLVSQITMPSVSSGVESLCTATSSSQASDDLSWRHRRHISMVEEITGALLIPAKMQVDDDLKVLILTELDEFHSLPSAHYFSSLSDRAPPLL